MSALANGARFAELVTTFGLSGAIFETPRRRWRTLFEWTYAASYFDNWSAAIGCDS